jgi:hypothetical protein
VAKPSGDATSLRAFLLRATTQGRATPFAGRRFLLLWTTLPGIAGGFGVGNTGHDALAGQVSTLPDTGSNVGSVRLLSRSD